MTSRIETLHLPSPAPGTRREVMCFRYGPIGARPKVYLQGSLHADELPGMVVLHHVVGLLDALSRRKRLQGEIVVVPTANPIGLDQVINGTHLGRFDLSSGRNFNRDWPVLGPAVFARVGTALTDDPAANAAMIRAALLAETTAHAPTSESGRLKQILHGLALDADIVLDLHCDEVGLMHLYTAPDCWPGLADLAGEIGAEATLIEEASGGSPFDESCSGPWAAVRREVGTARPIPQGCVSATIELRGKGDVDDTLAAQDAAALLRFLARRGFVLPDAGEAARPPAPTPPEPVPLTAVDVVRAPVAGIVCYTRRPGDRVQAGEPIATILDPTVPDRSAARVPVTASTDGLVLTVVRHPLVRAGAVVAKVVGRTPLAYRTGLLLED